VSEARILRLFPTPAEEVTLRGLYLQQALHRLGSPEAPFVYADFVSSLDGRIAVAGRVPLELTGSNDLRLLLELQAQADCMITHAGYLRSIAQGRLGDILEVGTREDTRDLALWRREQGLPAQPSVTVVSSSLDFPMPASLARDAGRVLIATGAEAAADRIEAWRKEGYRVMIAGSGTHVEGTTLTRQLSGLGFRSIFLLAGPRMLETMLRGQMLSRLYVTMVHRLVGGESMETMISGSELASAGRLRLGALYHDPHGPDATSQWFAQFDTAGPEG
jgi:riboflavin biosynthesis pyrimidine reductase